MWNTRKFHLDRPEPSGRLSPQLQDSIRSYRTKLMTDCAHFILRNRSAARVAMNTGDQQRIVDFLGAHPAHQLSKATAVSQPCSVSRDLPRNSKYIQFKCGSKPKRGQALARRMCTLHSGHVTDFLHRTIGDQH